VDVLLHLHGASSAVEPAVVEAGWTGVLVEFNRKGLSSVYSRPFSDPALFPRLLDSSLRALREAKVVDDPQLGRVVVSAFSAGFGGVRELLKVPEHVRRIDAIVLADSLYCGYQGDPRDRRLDPALMSGFRAFAEQAASGTKRMVITHSAQIPEGYGSTTETADDLIRQVGGKSEASRVDQGNGFVTIRAFRKGGLVILGYEGAGPEDHMRHLRRVALAWRLLAPQAPGS
jgi:hypothetical protein